LYLEQFRSWDISVNPGLGQDLRLILPAHAAITLCKSLASPLYITLL
jgi:hypothetical protein